MRQRLHMSCRIHVHFAGNPRLHEQQQLKLQQLGAQLRSNWILRHMARDTSGEKRLILHCDIRKVTKFRKILFQFPGRTYPTPRFRKEDSAVAKDHFLEQIRRWRTTILYQTGAFATEEYDATVRVKVVLKPRSERWRMLLYLSFCPHP